MAVTQGNGLNRGVADPPIYDRSTDSDDIRRDIDRTRSEMDRTIDEFAERLQPRNLFDDAICAVRESLFGSKASSGSGNSQLVSDELSTAARQAGRGLLDTVRENPVPAALMGAGLAWLLFEDKAERSYRRMRHDYNQRGYRGNRWQDPGTHSGSFVDARTGKPYTDEYGAGYRDYDFDGEPDEAPSGLKDKVAGAASSVKHAASSVGESIGNAADKVGDLAGKTVRTARTAADRTRSAASTAGRSARSAGRSAGEYGRVAGSSLRHAGSAMGDYGHDAADSMRQYGRSVSDSVGHGITVSRERFDDTLERQPLVVGLAALATGLLAGLALPHTRVEDRLYGSTSDRLKDEARRRGEEAYEEGKEVAMHVADAALGDAEGQGLTPGSLGDKIAKVAKDVVHTAQESAEREGIDPRSIAEKAKHVGESVKQKSKEELRQKKSSVGDEAGSKDESSLVVKDTPSAACKIETSDYGATALGGLSDDMSSAPSKEATQRESATKQKVAEGMSKASEKAKPKDMSGGCEC